MAVTATFHGKQYSFPDGTTDDQIYQYLNTPAANGPSGEELNAPPPVEQAPEDPGWGIGKVSAIPGAIKENWDAMLDSVMAANIGQSGKEEATRQYLMQEDRVAEAEKELGTAGKVVSGVGRYGPGIAVSLANPYAGAAVLGGMTTADTLRSQYAENQEFDMPSAVGAGAATSVTDLATGGLGRFISKPGTGLGAKTLAKAKEIVAEDVSSAALSKVYENWASGKDTLDDVGMAAMMGGAAGTAIRGATKAPQAVGRFKNAARDMNLRPNQGSEQAIRDATQIDLGPGPSPSSEFTDDLVNYSTLARSARDDLMNATNDVDLGSRIEGLNKVLNDGAHLDATSRFAKALQSDEAHIIDSMFDSNIEMPDGTIFNIGKDGLKLTQEQMNKAREDLTNAKGHNIPFRSRTGELDEGLTATSFNEKSQKFGRKIRKNMQGAMDKNLTYLTENLRKAELPGSGVSREELGMWKEAVQSYTGLRDAATTYNKESDGINTSYTAKTMANRFNDVITRLGRDQDILNINGEKGPLNPLADFQAFTAITEGFRAQNKQFSQGKPDTLKPQVVNTLYGVGTVAGSILHPGVGAAVAAKKVADEVLKKRGRLKAGGRVKDAKARAATLAEQTQTALNKGDGPGAAAAAALDLEAQGIKTDTTPVQPTPVKETPTEAPVSPVETVQQFRKADARARPAPAPKATQEPVAEATPAPASKPDAKAAAKPQKSKNELRKEREAARKAEAQARKEAKQAAIAAQLQADIQAGAKRGEPLGRTAPAKAGKKAAEEAPVETREEFEARTKDAEAWEASEKARLESELAQERSKRRAKAKPAEPVKAEEPAKVEPTPEPEVEAPKPDAKSRTKPEPKKAEEPVQEAPPVKERTPLGRKAPQRKVKEEEAPESVTEAPVKEAEVEAAPEPKAIPAAKLVREPLKKVADEQWPLGRRRSDPTGYRAHMAAKEDLKTVDNMMRTHDKYTPEEIAQAIEDTGGAQAFLAQAKDSGKTPDTFLGLRMRELERLRQKEVATKTTEMKAILKEQTGTVPKADTAAAKAEKAKLDRKEFDDEMDALGYHPDDVAQVSKSIEEKGYSLKNARKEASRLNTERKNRMRDEMDTDAAALKEANATLDLQGRKAQVDEYVAGLKVEGDSTIQGMIDTVFKHNDTKVTPKEVQNLLNKIDNHLAAEKKRYSAIDKADPRAPEYEAKAAAYRSAQNTLKSNRRNVDRVYSQANKDAQEATEALTKRERDFDALFRQANERDANIVQVRNQKDELFDKLTGQGFDEMDVRKYIGSTFFEREGTPLTELGKKHTIEKFIDQQANARKDSIAAKAKAVKSIVKDTDNGTVIQMTNDLMESVEFDPKMGSADELLGMTQALHEEAVSRGMTKEADRLKLFNEGIIEGKVNKIKYPDNPELWVPYEVKTGIQGTFGNAGSAYAGNLLKKINAAVTGDADGVKGFMTKPRNAMKAASASAEGKMKGKLATGDDDIVMK